jgi:hypothetical protein
MICLFGQAYVGKWLLSAIDRAARLWRTGTGRPAMGRAGLLVEHWHRARLTWTCHVPPQRGPSAIGRSQFPAAPPAHRRDHFGALPHHQALGDGRCELRLPRPACAHAQERGHQGARRERREAARVRRALSSGSGGGGARASPEHRVGHRFRSARGRVLFPGTGVRRW